MRMILSIWVKNLIVKYKVLNSLKQKRFSPYEYMSSFEKFKEKLPDQNEFYSSLSGKEIGDKEYQHVLKVWNKFGMKPMKDSHDLHLNCDVLLLANVFEEIRNRCLENYDLCPSHYFNAPALSWDSMLGMTKVELDLISDVDKYLLFEKGMRGGVSYISKRYSKANNKYLAWCDPKKTKKYITYLNKNNFQGYAM